MLGWLKHLVGVHEYRQPCGCCYGGHFTPIPPPCDKMKAIINERYIADRMEPPYTPDGRLRRHVQDTTNPNVTDCSSTYVFDASCPYADSPSIDGGCDGGCGDGGGGGE